MLIHKHWIQRGLTFMFSKAQDIYNLEQYINVDTQGYYYVTYFEYDIYSAFQPIYNSELGIIGFESLARIFKNNISIDPNHFFSNLSGQAEELFTLLCIRVHLLNFSILKRRHESVKVFVNVSPTIFLNRSKNPQEILNRLKGLVGLNIRTSDIAYELLEYDFDDISSINESIDLVRSLGYRIALDDYGQGKCDLSRVKEVKSDYVKIDRQLTGKFLKYRSEIKDVISHCVDKKIKVIAEGIEKKEQLDYFSSLGIYGYQGYYLSKPVTINAIQFQ